MYVYLYVYVYIYIYANFFFFAFVIHFRDKFTVSIAFLWYCCLFNIFVFINELRAFSIFRKCPLLFHAMAGFIIIYWFLDTEVLCLSLFREKRGVHFLISAVVSSEGLFFSIFFFFVPWCLQTEANRRVVHQRKIIP